MTSLLTGLLGAKGPAAFVTHLIPDRHHFRGSFGGKDIVGLWRDAAATKANVASGVLDVIGERIGAVLPEDLFAYVYAILQAPSYTSRFYQELEIPGPRIPFTREPALFARGVELGRRLIWLHTYGERMIPPGERAGRVPQGSARYEKPVPQTEDGYPARHHYDEDKRELHVGEGVFAPVGPEVARFEVSGLHVVGSWLDYRMKSGAGRRSSPLDEIRPTVWPQEFTVELLQLLWILEHTVALGPALDDLLATILAGELFAADDLPQPSEAERRPPG